MDATNAVTNSTIAKTVGSTARFESRIRRPSETVLVLISDLFEGGIRQKCCGALPQSTRQLKMVTLLALNDQGAPAYDKNHAEAFASYGVPCFACTPDMFPK